MPPIVSLVDPKVCRSCGRTKEANAFRKTTIRGRMVRRAWCRECMSLYYHCIDAASSECFLPPRHANQRLQPVRCLEGQRGHLEDRFPARQQGPVRFGQVNVRVLGVGANALLELVDLSQELLAVPHDALAALAGLEAGSSVSAN